MSKNNRSRSTADNNPESQPDDDGGGGEAQIGNDVPAGQPEELTPNIDPVSDDDPGPREPDPVVPPQGPEQSPVPADDPGPREPDPVVPPQEAAGPSLPGMAWAAIAASAYRAYSECMGGKNSLGVDLPEFHQQPMPMQIAWEAAVRQVHECVTKGKPDTSVGERKWRRWTPPSTTAPPIASP